MSERKKSAFSFSPTLFFWKLFVLRMKNSALLYCMFPITSLFSHLFLSFGSQLSISDGDGVISVAVVEEPQTHTHRGWGKCKGANETRKPQLPSFLFSDIWCVSASGCLYAFIRVFVCVCVCVSARARMLLSGPSYRICKCVWKRRGKMCWGFADLWPHKVQSPDYVFEESKNQLCWEWMNCWWMEFSSPTFITDALLLRVCTVCCCIDRSISISMVKWGVQINPEREVHCECCWPYRCQSAVKLILQPFCINYLVGHFYSSVERFPFGTEQDRNISLKVGVWPVFLWSVLAEGQLNFPHNE